MNVDWSLLWFQLWHMLVAFALALPIGLDREREARSAGLRTFPLVAVATCGFLLVGLSMFDGDDAQARIIYGIITGIGFIGGGAILKQESSVHGTATAASLWNTGAIGVAVAADQFSVAIMLALLNMLLLRLKHWMPQSMHKQDAD